MKSNIRDYHDNSRKAETKRNDLPGLGFGLGGSQFSVKARPVIPCIMRKPKRKALCSPAISFPPIHLFHGLCCRISYASSGARWSFRVGHSTRLNQTFTSTRGRNMYGFQSRRAVDHCCGITDVGTVHCDEDDCQKPQAIPRAWIPWISGVCR